MAIDANHHVIGEVFPPFNTFGSDLHFFIAEGDIRFEPGNISYEPDGDNHQEDQNNGYDPE
jgi:hypothetical protein